MKTAHTPGPWIVLFPTNIADAPVFATQDAAEAFVQRANNETAGNVETHAMPLALADAAPDLLAALHAIVDYVAVNEMTVAPALPVAPERMKAIARAAIAKATA